MIHKTNKVKFNNGQDANQMLMRKLAYNFLHNAGIKTTEAKAKALKTFMDRIVSKSKEKSEANKNFMMKYFNDKQTISVLFDQVGPAVAKINGGFVKIVRHNQRENDGSMMVQLLWAHPVVIDWESENAKAKSDKKVSADEGKKVVKSKKVATSKAK